MKRPRTQTMAWEIGIFAAILLGANITLFLGAPAAALVFFPDLVAGGEWWRVLAHPFVHVSFYHLLLDATAFFILYTGLSHWKAPRRWAAFVGCAAGSLLVSIAASPQVAVRGLCGLSGIAHGLMAVWALDMMRQDSDKQTALLGLLCFIGIVGKSVLECATGGVLFASLHIGSVGSPIVASHAGGVLGGILAYLLGILPLRLPQRESGAIKLNIAS